MGYPKIPTWDNKTGRDLGKYSLGFMDNEIISYSIYNDLHYGLVSNYNYLSDDFNFNEETLSSPIYSVSGKDIFSRLNDFWSSTADSEVNIFLAKLDPGAGTTKGYDINTAIKIQPPENVPLRPVTFSVVNSSKGAGLSCRDFLRPGDLSGESSAGQYGFMFDYCILLPKLSNTVGHKVDLFTSFSISLGNNPKFIESYTAEADIRRMANKISERENLVPGYFNKSDITLSDVQTSGDNYVFSNVLTWEMVDKVNTGSITPPMISDHPDKALALYKTRVFIPLPATSIWGSADGIQLYLTNISVYSGGTGNAHSGNVTKAVLADKTHRKYPKFNMDNAVGYSNRPNGIGLYSTGVSTSSSYTGIPGLVLSLATTKVGKSLPGEAVGYGTPTDYNALFQFVDSTGSSYDEGENAPDNWIIQGNYSHPWNVKDSDVKSTSVTTYDYAILALSRYVLKSDIIRGEEPLTEVQMTNRYMIRNSYIPIMQRYHLGVAINNVNGTVSYDKKFNLFARDSGSYVSLQKELLPLLPKLTDKMKPKYFHFRATVKFYNEIMLNSLAWKPTAGGSIDLALWQGPRPGMGFDMEFRGSIEDVIDSLPRGDMYNNDNKIPCVDISGFSYLDNNNIRRDVITLDGRHHGLRKYLPSTTPNFSPYMTTTMAVTTQGTNEPYLAFSHTPHDVLTAENLTMVQAHTDAFYNSTMLKSSIARYAVWRGAITAVGDSAQWDDTINLAGTSPRFLSAPFITYFKYMYIVTRSPAGNHVSLIVNPFNTNTITVLKDLEFHVLNLSDSAPFRPIVYKWAVRFEKFRSNYMASITGGASANLATGSFSGNTSTNRTIVEIGLTSNTAWVDNFSQSDPMDYVYHARTKNFDTN